MLAPQICHLSCNHKSASWTQAGRYLRISNTAEPSRLGKELRELPNILCACCDDDISCRGRRAIEECIIPKTSLYQTHFDPARTQMNIHCRSSPIEAHSSGCKGSNLVEPIVNMATSMQSLEVESLRIANSALWVARIDAFSILRCER